LPGGSHARGLLSNRATGAPHAVAVIMSRATAQQEFLVQTSYQREQAQVCTDGHLC
ncbi:hypothetical protein EJB05_36087, partial [Eragrostis curvula]